MSFLYWYLELALPIERVLIGGGLVPRLLKQQSLLAKQAIVGWSGNLTTTENVVSVRKHIPRQATEGNLATQTHGPCSYSKLSSGLWELNT